MQDFNCVLAGIARILGPVIMLVIWNKKTGARIFPAPVAFAVCIPVFIMGGAIRMGFNPNDFYSYYVKQGLLYGILEEGSKFLMLRYVLTSYSSCKDAVTYGIGHGAYEMFWGGIACLGLIGTGKAAPEIVFVNVFSVIEGIPFAAAMTVLIYYGISTGRTKIMLPLVILLHAFCNMVSGLFSFSTMIVVIFSSVTTAVICFAAYRCWKSIQLSDEY